MSFGDERIRRRVLEADRVRIDDLLRDDRLGVGENGPGCSALGHAVDRERDVLGGELAPSWNLTPLRSLNSHVVGSITFHDVAMPGSSSNRRPSGRACRRCAPRVVVGEEVEEVRIHRRDVGGDGNLQLLRGGAGGRTATVSARTTAQADRHGGKDAHGCLVKEGATAPF
jgi:hypothetical protein